MRIVVAAVGALAAAAAVSLSACASSSSGDPTVAPSSESVQAGGSSSTSGSASGPTSFPSSSSAPPSSAAPTGGLTEAEATAALLTAAEVGAGFVDSAPDDSSDPLPCEPDQPPLDQRFPAPVDVQKAFEDATGKAFFGEQIQTYDSAATADKVVAAGEKGLACGTATVGGEQTTIDGPIELTSKVGAGVDKAEGWTLVTKSVNASIVVAQLGQQLVVFSFASTPDVDDSALPDAAGIVKAALAKVAAAS